MAVLEKIRKRSLLLIVVIGICLLMFILSGLVGKGGMSLFNDYSNIGKVDGTPIDRVQFAETVQNTSSRNPNASIMDAVNSVWDQQVNNIILNEQYEDLGITVEGDRIINLVKNNPQIVNNKMFQNDKGIFEPQKFVNYIADAKKGNPAMYENWKMQEEYMINQAKFDIYTSLIQAGLGVTEKEGEISYAEESDVVDFKYVQVPYTSIIDSTLTITDSEIEAYIKAHKEEFDRDATRDVKFVMFEEKPTDADTKAIEDEVTKYTNGWVNRYGDSIKGLKETNDLVGFIAEYSDIKYDSTAFVQKSALSAKFADTLYNLNVGQVYGPYKDGDYFKSAKMVAKKPGGAAKVTHILISYDSVPQIAKKEDRTKEQAEALANQLMERIKKGEDMTALVEEYSEDTGAPSNKGVYDNVSATSGMVEPFKNFAVEKEKGTVGVVETQFGFHVMRIEDKYSTVNIATLARKIESSEATIKEVFNQSNKLVYSVIEEGKTFDDAAKEVQKVVKRQDGLEELAGGLTGLRNQRAIVRWAFEATTSVGDVKKFNVPNGYAVVEVTGIHTAGLQTAAGARAKVAPILLKQKKAEKIMSESKGKSMADLASAYKVGVRNASDITLSAPTISGAGNEPKVVGTAFALKSGETSGLIEGEKGVYMIELTKREESPKLMNYTTYRNAKRDANVQKYSQSVIDALKKSSDIEDNRALFY